MPEQVDRPLSTAEARDSFATVVNRAAYSKERVVLTRHGRALVAVVPIEDVALLEALETSRDDEEARAAVVAWREDPVGTITSRRLAAKYGFRN